LQPQKLSNSIFLSKSAIIATKLKSKNIKNLDDFIGYNAETLSKIMNCGLKIAQDSLDEAKKIKLNESIS
jgi:hypothetical protein